MPDNKPRDIQDLVKQYACTGELIDRINDPKQQQTLNQLSTDEQKELAQKIVIEWIEQGYDTKELLSILRMNPDIHASQFHRELTDFNHFLVHAVNLFAAFNVLCAERNPHPENSLQDITPDTFDVLNDMPQLKSCLFNRLLLPQLDSIVLKIKTPQDWNKLIKAFRSEESIADQFNQAIVVKEWVNLLNGDNPWTMFEQRGVNADLFLAHASLVEAMISEEDAVKIGCLLQNTPSKSRANVSSTLHTLDETFKGINRGSSNNNIFTIINNSMATFRPSLDEIRKVAHEIKERSLFKPVDSKKDEPSSENKYHI